MASPHAYKKKHAPPPQRLFLLFRTGRVKVSDRSSTPGGGPGGAAAVRAGAASAMVVGEGKKKRARVWPGAASAPSLTPGHGRAARLTFATLPPWPPPLASCSAWRPVTSTWSQLSPARRTASSSPPRRRRRGRARSGRDAAAQAARRARACRPPASRYAPGRGGGGGGVDALVYACVPGVTHSSLGQCVRGAGGRGPRGAVADCARPVSRLSRLPLPSLPSPPFPPPSPLSFLPTSTTGRSANAWPPGPWQPAWTQCPGCGQGGRSTGGLGRWSRRCGAGAWGWGERKQFYNCPCLTTAIARRFRGKQATEAPPPAMDCGASVRASRTGVHTDVAH